MKVIGAKLQGRRMAERGLLQKLGFKAGMVARLSAVPPDLAAAFEAATATQGQGDGDWHICFVRDAAAIRRAAQDFVPGYGRGQHLWLAYPRKDSGLAPDINRDRGWDPLQAMDLLPVTQISLGPVWSALRWRYRDEIRTITRKA
jgi:hypothetical protein